ncbi:MAG: hypothetical protein QW101_04025 [Ignisphaera sp.]|uniref:Uncharacterized protein n=1 Tax=Ignisphaera aggregans TaxID=334771 RepID=A0A7J3N0F7_9CREN
MICCILSEELSDALMDELVNVVAQQTRIIKSEFFTLIFISDNVDNVFAHRDVFTRHIDIGVRVYIENGVEKIYSILKSCKHIYVSSKDYRAVEVLKKIKDLQTIYAI